VQAGFYGFQNVKDAYAQATHRAGLTMNKGLVLRFCKSIAIIICPIVPHCSEHIWKLIGEPGFVVNQKWPEVGEVNELLLKKNNYINVSLHTFRLKLDGYLNQTKQQVTPPKNSNIYVATKFTDFQEKVINIVASVFKDKGGINFPDNNEITPLLKQEKSVTEIKNGLKNAMTFVATLKAEFKIMHEDALQSTIPFDEKELLTDLNTYISKELGDVHVSVFSADDESAPEAASKRNFAKPGRPLIFFS